MTDHDTSIIDVKSATGWSLGWAARRMDRAGVSRNVIAERTHLNSRTLWAAFDAEEIAS